MFSRTDFPSTSPCSDDSTVINMYTIQASTLTPWFILSSDLISYGGGLVAKSCRTLAILWTVAYQAPLSMGFSRQEHWGDLPFPPPGDLLDPGSNLGLLHCRLIPYLLSYQGSPRWAAETLECPILFVTEFIFFPHALRISKAETEYTWLLRSFKTFPLWLRGRCCSVYLQARKLSPWTWSEETHSAWSLERKELHSSFLYNSPLFQLPVWK